MYAIVIVLILLSPALLAGSLLFPFYWISQVRLVRRTGSWILHRDAHSRWMRIFARGILVSYVVIGGALFWPEVFPTVRHALENRWMFAMAIPMAIDAAILMSLSPDRAAEEWRVQQSARQPDPGGPFTDSQASPRSSSKKGGSPRELPS
jgi:hypothetical protein